MTPSNPSPLFGEPQRLTRSDFKLTADLGDAWAQFRVGKLLYYGAPPIVIQNQAQGKSWIERAATQGYEPAQKLLANLGTDR